MRKDIRQDIIKEIQRIFKEQGEISLSLFRRYSKFSRWHLFKNFNSWNEAVELAGLKADYGSRKIEDNKLFEELKRVIIKIGKIPTIMAFQRESKISFPVYWRRFGNRWSEILLAFRK